MYIGWLIMTPGPYCLEIATACSVHQSDDLKFVLLIRCLFIKLIEHGYFRVPVTS